MTAAILTKTSGKKPNPRAYLNEQKFPVPRVDVHSELRAGSANG